ncbi:hypothetical protein BDD26_1472 [Xenorhabdus cabanillasii]|uniref:Uncharacterized protein n=1 Tax=Xenorhabdus cabanillasii TaxID=351673 RepID=A0A3D9UC55_9GAMM|nr:hypothetical protein Xcab_00238 [Xenorhabdus cabanillasii JM26]REF26787.1 hypothetical protein BDD26_1472 [Xenorhabdus cabanillasii]
MNYVKYYESIATTYKSLTCGYNQSLCYERQFSVSIVPVL